LLIFRWGFHSTLNFKDKSLVTTRLHFFVQNVTKNWRMYPGHEAISAGLINASLNFVSSYLAAEWNERLVSERTLLLHPSSFLRILDKLRSASWSSASQNFPESKRSHVSGFVVLSTALSKITSRLMSGRGWQRCYHCFEAALRRSNSR
jgi:hypothetical protein